MVKFGEFCQLVRKFAKHADFAVIYISEAHATDGWNFAENLYKIRNHVSLQDRINAAKILREVMPREDNLTLHVDSMENDANQGYAGLFERLYIVHRGRIAYMGEPGPNGYCLDEVKEWLDQFANGNST